MAIVIRELQNIVGLEVTKAYLGFLFRTIKPTVFDVINTSKGVSPSSALYLEEKDIISPWWATADIPLSAVGTDVVFFFGWNAYSRVSGGKIDKSSVDAVV
jgi:hypothetical protein